MQKLENWSARYLFDSGYLPPESQCVVIVGTVFGSQSHKDGKRITTSPVIQTKGRVIITRSGSKYELGEPSEEYLQFLKENNRTLDNDNPIKVVY